MFSAERSRGMGKLFVRLVHFGYRIKLWFYKRKLMRLAKHCKLVDELFIINDVGRHERKRFWKSFYKRAAVLDDLINEINWDEV